MPIRIILPLTAALFCAQLSAAPADFYPTKAWRESTPEAQGLDAGVLAGMVDNITRKHLNVHSITLIRHGNVVLDTYFYPYKPDAPHDVASVTKSITAALVGIAIDKGLVKTDQKLLSFFPAEAPPDADAQKQKITIVDVLTMQPGLDCGFAPGEQELAQMRLTTNWVKYTLALPMKYEPGTKFGYCSPGYHLLSSVVTAASHEPELEFAKKNLFEPLGIGNVIWPADEQGRTHGWGDSHFVPRDFAKIGYLYLHGGVWNGRQIVSSEWVRKSTTRQADPGRGPDHGYGYGWWLATTQGMEEFGGNGRGGQIVAVWPEKDMIVVLTGAGYPAAEVTPAIIKSIQADKALPPNAEADNELKAKVSDAAKAPPATLVTNLPAMAKTVSGKVYAFPHNASRLDSLSLAFSGRTEAQVKVKYQGTELTMPVGLDGVYRLGPYGPQKLLAGATGKWTSDTDFLLDLNLISNINHYTIAMHFSEGGVEATVGESSGLIRNGKLTGRPE